MDLDLRRLRAHRLAPSTRPVLSMLLSAGILGSFFILHVAPMSADTATRRSRLETMAAERGTSRMNSERLTRVTAEVADLEQQLIGAQERLTGHHDVAGILRDVHASAAEADLTVREFKPLTPVARPQHHEWPLALQLEGRYDSLLLFLVALGESSRLMTVDQISIRRKPEGTPGSSIEVECVLTVTTLAESPGSPPAPHESTD